MTFSRYRKRRQVSNSSELYKKAIEVRDLNQINHFTSPAFNYDLENLDFDAVEHIWKYGDRLSKLAEFYYGDPTLWWIISFVNQKPTEHHFIEGETILIPNPPGKVLEFIGI